MNIFLRFLEKVKSRLARIAYASRCGMSGTDLQTDVWIAASEIAERRGYEIDFADDEDQELVLARVFVMARKQSGWQLRSCLSIDAASDSNFDWIERIPESISTDPLSILLGRELAAEQMAKLKASYSQAKAYLIMLDRFDHDQSLLGRYLGVAASTLRKRISHAIDFALSQPSLFDRYDCIDEGFYPSIRGQVVVRRKIVSDEVQAELQF